MKIWIQIDLYCSYETSSSPFNHAWLTEICCNCYMLQDIYQLPALLIGPDVISQGFHANTKPTTHLTTADDLMQTRKITWNYWVAKNDTWRLQDYQCPLLRLIFCESNMLTGDSPQVPALTVFINTSCLSDKFYFHLFLNTLAGHFFITNNDMWRVLMERWENLL